MDFLYLKMKNSRLIYILVIVFLAVILRIGANSECQQRVNNCTLMVKPYLNDLRYMFPTNLEDVDEMCRMWSQFVDCVRKYVSQCFSEDRKLLFHKSVENSVDTVHAICSSEIYQKEYLSNAVCFKRISVDSCGQFYRQLIGHVSNPRAHDDHICCSYGQFKNCVNDPLLRECGRRARSLMDHSMAFLISRCAHLNLDSLSERCPTPVEEPTPELVTPTPTTTEENFYEGNDISYGKTRADRSYKHSDPTEPLSSDNTEQSSPEDHWTPKSIVYTLPPESESQRSSTHSLFCAKSTETLLKSFFVSIIFSFFRLYYNYY